MSNNLRTNTLSISDLGALYTSDDHRYNLHENNVPENVKKQACAVACLIKEDKLLFSNETGVFNFKNPSTLAQRHSPPLAKDCKFRDEFVIGFGTAFLVAPNLVLTAAHCITNGGILDEDLISKTRLIFNLQMNDSGKLPSSIDKSEIYMYNPKNILWSKKDGEDWALIELDRNVTAVDPIQLDFNDITAKTDVYMLGHPNGLSMKYTDSGIVQFIKKEPTVTPEKNLQNDSLQVSEGPKKSEEIAKETSFKVAIDAFKGNSGSPVFNKITGKAIGILVRGNEDYSIEEEALSPSAEKELVISTKNHNNSNKTNEPLEKPKNKVTVYHRVKVGEGFEICQKISAISQEAIDKINLANNPPKKEAKINKIKVDLPVHSKKETKIKKAKVDLSVHQSSSSIRPPVRQSKGNSLNNQLTSQSVSLEKLYSNHQKLNRKNNGTYSYPVIQTAFSAKKMPSGHSGKTPNRSQRQGDACCQTCVIC